MINKLVHKIMIKDNLSQNKERERLAKISGTLGIVINSFLFILKGLLGLFTGSISLIADAFNHLSDTASSIITIVGFRIAAKEPDHEHPYGHGRVEYLTGLSVSVLIIIVGYQFVISSMKRILTPTVVTTNPGIILVLFLSLFFKFFIYKFNQSLGKEMNSNALLATAKDAISDVLTSSVVIIGLILSPFTSLPIDGIAGVLIALYIIYSGISLSIMTASPLLGEKPDRDLAEKIKARVISFEPVIDVHDLQIHNYGPTKTMATIDVEVPSYLDLVTLHNLVDIIERNILEELGINLVIHVDPVNNLDEHYLKVKQIIGEIVLSIPNVLSFHDLQYTGHSENELIILEIVVDTKNTTDLSRSLIKMQLEEKLRERFKTAKIKITLDLDVTIL